jgi:hypothetical protein
MGSTVFDVSFLGIAGQIRISPLEGARHELTLSGPARTKSVEADHQTDPLTVMLGILLKLAEEGGGDTIRYGGCLIKRGEGSLNGGDVAAFRQAVHTAQSSPIIIA